MIDRCLYVLGTRKEPVETLPDMANEPHTVTIRASADKCPMEESLDGARESARRLNRRAQQAEAKVRKSDKREAAWQSEKRRYERRFNELLVAISLHKATISRMDADIRNHKVTINNFLKYIGPFPQIFKINISWEEFEKLQTIAATPRPAPSEEVPAATDTRGVAETAQPLATVDHPAGVGNVRA